VIGGFYIGKHYCNLTIILYIWAMKKKYLIWWIFVIYRIFVICQTAKINSKPNFLLLYMVIYYCVHANLLKWAINLWFQRIKVLKSGIIFKFPKGDKEVLFMLEEPYISIHTYAYWTVWYRINFSRYKFISELIHYRDQLTGYQIIIGVHQY